MAARQRSESMVSFTIEAEQKRQIVALATIWKVPRSWVIRYILDRSLPTLTANPVSPFKGDGVISDEQAAD